MIYALDTNIISYVLRDDENVKERWRTEELRGNKTVLPLIVYYETMRGLVSVNAGTKMRAFEKICEKLEIGNLTIEDMNTAAQIYSNLKNQGCTVDDADLLIAAQCISNGYTLVTNNTKHFENIDGLSLENWAV